MAYSGDVRDKAYQFYQGLVGNAGTLEDMKAKYFISQVGGADPYDAERKYLQSQGGTGNSIPELWRSYLNTKGYTGKLSNMLNSFYQGDSFSGLGYSLQFASGTQKATAVHNTSIDLTGTFSIGAWIYPTNIGEEVIIDKGGYTASGYTFLINAAYFALTNTFGLLINGSILYANSESITANQWNHLVATYDGSNVKLYKNGALNKTTAWTTNPITNTASLTIGNKSDNTRDFIGNIDEAFIYKGRVLDLTEIGNIYNQKELKVDSLSAYWKMTEGTGTTITDASGNDNHAAISGATWSSSNKTPNNKALSFNGSTDKVVTTLWNNLTSGYSMGAWFKSNNYAQIDQFIMMNGSSESGAHRGFGICLGGNDTTDGSIYLADANIAWIDAGFKVQNNNWNHIFITVNTSTSISVYLNGVLQGTVTPSAIATPNTQSLIATDGTSGKYFNGTIDHVQVYGSILTAGQIADIYYYGATDVKPTNQYCFTEGSGSTALDTGTSAKDGTITGATYTQGYTAPTVTPLTATGGTITSSGPYTIHTFSSSGTFTPATTGIVDVLVVGAGAGGGGPAGRGGGGGAGEYEFEQSHLVTAQAYTVTVGTGGAGSTAASTKGVSGGNSVFDTITGLGGGGGGTGPGASKDGANGGNGGGGGDHTGAGAGGVGSPGNDGGVGFESAPSYGAGGGGGAGADGEAGSAIKGGDGGVGILNSISGTATYYSGGGGGASADAGATYGAGGTGGGGRGASGNAAAVAGTDGTGGGGGGGNDSGPYNGADGGDGIVIVRYLT